MKEQENSQKNINEALSPKEEKEIIEKLRLEANSFVPDLLLNIMSLCGTNVEIPDDKDIISTFKDEAKGFTPSVLAEVEKATGTFNPIKNQDEMALTMRVHNEGVDLVPDVQEEVYSTLGHRKPRRTPFFQKKTLLPIGLSLAAVAIAIPVIVISQKPGTTVDATGSSFVSVSFTPASKLAQGASATGGGETVNNYVPSWSYEADSENIVKAATFAPNNYSANLVGYSFSSASKEKSWDLAAGLIAPTYEKGYLETIDKNQYNGISISVVSSISSYADSFAENYQTSINEALKQKGIYAKISFSVSEESSSTQTNSSAEEMSSAKKLAIAKIYEAFNREVSLDDLDANLDEEVATSFSTIISDSALAPVTTRGQQALWDGLQLLYTHYITQDENLPMTKDEYDNFLNFLKSKPGALPWGSNETNPHIAEELSQSDFESYFVVGDIISDDTYNPVWNAFKTIRDYILIKNTQTKESTLTFLSSVESRVKRSQSDDYALPDGTNQERPDDGKHGHGDGHKDPDWGEGGGHWNDGRDGQDGGWGNDW